MPLLTDWTDPDFGYEDSQDCWEARMGPMKVWVGWPMNRTFAYRQSILSVALWPRKPPNATLGVTAACAQLKQNKTQVVPCIVSSNAECRSMQNVNHLVCDHNDLQGPCKSKWKSCTSVFEHTAPEQAKILFQLALSRWKGAHIHNRLEGGAAQKTAMFDTLNLPCFHFPAICCGCNCVTWNNGWGSPAKYTTNRSCKQLQCGDCT